MRVAVESSGNFWVKLYEALEARGFRVVLSNPARTKAIAEARIRSDRLDGLIDEVSKVIARQAVEDPRVELLLGFKGIDYYTAMVVLYEVGDIGRFCSARKLVGWVGLCPSVHQSGEHCRRGWDYEAGEQVGQVGFGSGCSSGCSS